jgi:D-alanyl-D-alanine carboxypeptidase (penicillin-binding protein 5/6)
MRWHPMRAAGLAALMLGLSAALAPGPALAGSPRPPGPAPTADPAAGPVEPHDGGVIGGTELASSGVVVDRAPGVPALPAIVTSPAWIVADLDTSQVLAARDPHGRFRPASTLKELTALTLIPRLPAGTRITFQQGYYTLATKGTHGRSSLAGLVPGYAYTAEQLFLAMLLPSGNDAAEALAASVPGGRAATLAAMNTEARRLQAFDTRAETPDGLDATGQFSSAYDLALIARAGLQVPDFARYVGTVKATLPCRPGKLGCPKSGHFEIDNHNHVLTSMRGGIGVKNGGTTLAHQVVVGAAARGGHRMVAVVMRSDFNPYTQTIKLLEWGFAARGVAAPVGQLVDPLPDAPAAGPGAGHPAGAKDTAATTFAVVRKHHGGGVPWGWLALGGALVAAGTALRRSRRVSAPGPPAPPAGSPLTGDPRPDDDRAGESKPPQPEGGVARPRPPATMRTGPISHVTTVSPPERVPERDPH